MIDKNRIERIHADLRKTLEAFAVANNLSVSPFNMTYSPTGFKFTVQMGDKAELGDADPALAKNTKTYGSWYNLTVEDIGKEFTYGVEKVKFLGLKNKTMVIFEKNGQKFKTDGNRFATAIGKKVVDIHRGAPVGSW